jgi:uncharacterized membrane protein YgcG
MIRFSSFVLQYNIRPMYRRVNCIFNAKSLKRVKIRTFDIMWRLGVIIAIFLVLLVLLTAVGQPIAVRLETLAVNRITVTYDCELVHDEFEYVFFALEAAMLAYGGWLCYRTRGVPDAVNESKYISMAMGVIIFLCVIILPVDYAADLDHITQEFLAALGFGLSVLSSILIIFTPKLTILLSGRDVDRDMKVEKKAQAKVFAGGADFEEYEAELEEFKELMESCKKALRTCKKSDDKYALAQAQVAWWRAQAMNVGEAQGSASGGSSSGASSGAGSRANVRSSYQSRQEGYSSCIEVESGFDTLKPTSPRSPMSKSPAASVHAQSVSVAHPPRAAVAAIEALDV